MRIKTYQGRTIKEFVAQMRNSLGPKHLIVSATTVNGSGIKAGFEISALQGRNDGDDTRPSPVGTAGSELMSIYQERPECARGYREGQ